MCLFQYDDDPEPEEQVPVDPLYVPVRLETAELMVRLFRTPLGTRTAVGFTRPDLLTSAVGAEHPWIRLSEATLRSMTEPLGAALVTIDPTFTAPAVTGPTATRQAAVSASAPAVRGAAAARTA
ncbi:SAV_915 family protein [Streptomyces sp. NPDC002055]|uniref:SAV_915 family protein n=1 Tax=Streptomyces sp. NPDC002055 TaxID=3154534 RepID=UPI003326D72B